MSRHLCALIPMLLVFLVGIGATCGGDGPTRAPNDATGSWMLVSSMSAEQEMIAPKWDGELHVIGGRYSRFYVRRSGLDNVPFASFSDSGSWYPQKGGQVILTVEYSSFGPAVGRRYVDTLLFASGGNRLILRGESFEEIWERR